MQWFDTGRITSLKTLVYMTLQALVILFTVTSSDGSHKMKTHPRHAYSWRSWIR